MLRAIIAMDQLGYIGWPDDEDFIWRVRDVVQGRNVLMGRKLADRLKMPLPGKMNFVLTRDHHWAREGFETIHHLANLGDCCVIGGLEIFKLTQVFWAEMYVAVFRSLAGEKAFTIDLKHWEISGSTERSIHLTYLTYRRSRHD